MQLLDLKENGEITINPYALTFKPFENIWKRNKDKKKAVKELSYIFLMENKTNEFTFWHIDDRVERSREIIKHLFGKEDAWAPDKKTQDAIDFYRDNTQSFAEKYLEDAIIGANKSREFFTIIDWNERNEKTGAHIYDIKKLNDHLEKSVAVIDNIERLQEKVKEAEKKESSSRRAGRNKGTYEDMT